MAYHRPSHMHFNSQAELEACLDEVLSLIKPTADDSLKRRNAINEIAGAIQTDPSLVEIGAAVKPFGSYISNLYTRWGDLDISIDLTLSKFSPTARNLKMKVLKQIMWALRRTGVASNVEFIRSARVPVVVYVSKHYNISCDISIDNHAGYLKSYILRGISNIDERFRNFVLLIKEWAKAQHVNDPKTGTLNSYSLCLLIIFHFQTCTPVIFPPLKDFYVGSIVDDVKGKHDLTRLMDSFAASILRYTSDISRQKNKSSFCELFISFFNKFSGLESLASNYVICTYTGKWEPINSDRRWMMKAHHLLIEDPFERAENAARAVGARGLFEISRAFADMHRKLTSGSVVRDRNFLLSNLLRPEIRSKLDPGTHQIYNPAQPRAYLAGSVSRSSMPSPGLYDRYGAGRGKAVER